ncbi:MAG: malate synthase A, partial [Candidatus Limnocylindria bacterium]
MSELPASVQVIGPPGDRVEEVLTPEALTFIASLHRSFNPRRARLLADRSDRQARFDA